MNLSKLLRNSGIGCGKDCICVKTFAESLDPLQTGVLRHMMEAGTKKRLKKTKKALRSLRNNERNQADTSQQNKHKDTLLDELFGAKQQGGLDNLGAVLRAAMMAKMIQEEELNSTKPYVGDLATGHIEQLAKIPNVEREAAEVRLRKIIAMFGNDPSLVEITEVTDSGFTVTAKRPNDESATDVTEASPVDGTDSDEADTPAAA